MLAAQLALLAPSFGWRTLSAPSITPLRPIPPLARRYIRASLALIAVAALIGPLRRSSPPTPISAPAHARAGILNAGIWTVHFGLDNAGRDSQRGMRDVFRDLDLDIVGLLETDLHVSKGCFSNFVYIVDHTIHRGQYSETEICACMHSIHSRHY